jgi:hypothetical protein
MPCRLSGFLTFLLFCGLGLRGWCDESAWPCLADDTQRVSILRHLKMSVVGLASNVTPFELRMARDVAGLRSPFELSVPASTCVGPTGLNLVVRSAGASDLKPGANSLDIVVAPSVLNATGAVNGINLSDGLSSTDNFLATRQRIAIDTRTPALDCMIGVVALAVEDTAVHLTPSAGPSGTIVAAFREPTTAEHETVQLGTNQSGVVSAGGLLSTEITVRVPSANTPASTGTATLLALASTSATNTSQTAVHSQRLDVSMPSMPPTASLSGSTVAAFREPTIAEREVVQLGTNQTAVVPSGNFLSPAMIVRAASNNMPALVGTATSIALASMNATDTLQTATLSQRLDVSMPPSAEYVQLLTGLVVCTKSGLLVDEKTSDWHTPSLTAPSGFAVWRGASAAAQNPVHLLLADSRDSTPSVPVTPGVVYRPTVGIASPEIDKRIVEGVIDEAMLRDVNPYGPDLRRQLASIFAEGNFTNDTYRVFLILLADFSGSNDMERVASLSAWAEREEGGRFSPGVAYFIGYHLYKTFQYASAIGYIDRCLQMRDARKDRLLMLRALCIWGEGGHGPETLVAIGKFLKEHPKSEYVPQARFLAAWVNLYDGHTALARSLMEKLVADFPSSEFAARARQVMEGLPKDSKR